MGSIDDKGCYNPNTNSYILDLSKGNPTNMKVSHGRKTLNARSKPTPSKWDDAQKWLVGLASGGEHNSHPKSKPRNSNAEDRRLLAPLPQKGRDSCSSVDGGLLEDELALSIPTPYQDEGEMKKIDWSEESAIAIRSVSLRDMGTEMTPIASKEPSRTCTPIRIRSPTRSRMTSPVSHQDGNDLQNSERQSIIEGELSNSNSRVVVDKKVTSLESRAMAWDEAERTKYMARYKREEVKIQAWENHRTRKAEMEMKKIEVKAERKKARAQEKLANKIASTRRRAEEKRSNAEVKLNELAAKTSEKADYIRKTGHLSSSFFSLKLPSLCG